MSRRRSLRPSGEPEYVAGDPFVWEKSWAETMKGAARIRNKAAIGLRNVDESMKAPVGGSRIR
jgi:hypothetical protein